MKNQQHFICWLKNNTTLSQSSIDKYTAAINTISKELEQSNIINFNLYEIDNSNEIEILKNKYFSIEKYKEKNIKGNKMYSRALAYYIEFKKFVSEDKSFKYELIKSKHKYIQEVNRLTADNNTDFSIIDVPQDKPSFISSYNNKIWNRNPTIASQSIKKTNYKCENDKTHNFFTSKYNDKNYVEAHHLIPMKYQGQFEKSLDVNANIVALCIVCHKKLHFAPIEENKSILEKLYYLRKDRLQLCGLNITFNELLQFYTD
ncbi:HNH endonuclease [Alkaliphilus sp. B6464]|uniref:HNH endonuclease n=1 Tax=Alkaliphilus sp. B6464 TaxID=2731219 RepID=UPI001BA6BEF8|nr:hypothetical protein [Alkaliphilus sp. B6464]QUH21256.1 hypothetical protein HYG84_16115 [Alkaliphilus sp. B6464]